VNQRTAHHRPSPLAAEPIEEIEVLNDKVEQLVYRLRDRKIICGWPGWLTASRLPAIPVRLHLIA